MDASQVFELINKGLGILGNLIQTGVEVTPLIDRLKGIAQGGAAGTVTDAQLAEDEAALDAAIEEFNAPMPDEG